MELSCSVVLNTSSSLGFKHGQPTTFASHRHIPTVDPKSLFPCFNGIVDSALLPALSVCEGLIFLLNQLKTQSQSKTEPGMRCRLRHPRAKPCVGPCCISWGLSLWLSLLYLRKSPFLRHIPAKFWHSWMSNYRSLDLTPAFGAAQQHKR